MYQFAFEFDSEDVSADFDPASWHPAWCEVVPCAEEELVWDVDSDEEVS